MRYDLFDFLKDEKIAHSFEQLSFLTNDNCPNVQAKPMYERTAILYECITTNDCKKLIEVVVRRLEFNMRSKGTEYFIYTLLHLFHYNYSSKQCDSAFKEIAKIENISESLVKKRIINALNTMSNSVEKEEIYRYFPEYDGRHPSLMYSIDLALDRLNEIFNQRI